MADVYAATWYKPSLEAYNRRVGWSAKFKDFFQERCDDIGMSSCMSCVSIGVGTGDVDIPLLMTSFSKLRHYIAVEPSTEELVVFKDRLTKLGRTDIKVEIVNKRIEEWEGPRDPLDAVLLIYVISLIENRVALIKRCLDWLKPGGVLLIVVGGNDICFAPIARKFGISYGQYRANDVRADLESMGLKFQDAQIATHFDIRDRNRDVMNFLLQKDASQEELGLLDQYLHEIMPGGQAQQDAWSFWVEKPAQQIKT